MDNPNVSIVKLGSKYYRVDFSGNQITFLDQRFYVTENGTFVPSSTTICEAYPKGPGFFKWLKENGVDSDAIRDEAGRSGSVVHSLTEEYDNGNIVSLIKDGDISLQVKEWSAFEKYVQFRDMLPELVYEAIEKNLVSESLGFGGTIDRILTFRGKRYILDIKTGNYESPTWWLQLASYQRLVNTTALETGNDDFIKANYIDGVCILHLNAKTRTVKYGNMPGDGSTDLNPLQGKGWQLLVRSPAESMIDWQLFCKAQDLWISINSDTTPSMPVYCLNHQYSPKEISDIVVASKEKKAKGKISAKDAAIAAAKEEAAAKESIMAAEKEEAERNFNLAKMQGETLFSPIPSIPRTIAEQDNGEGVKAIGPVSDIPKKA